MELVVATHGRKRPVVTNCRRARLLCLSALGADQDLVVDLYTADVAAPSRSRDPTGPASTSTSPPLARVPRRNHCQLSKTKRPCET